MKRGFRGLLGCLWKHRRLVLPGVLVLVLTDLLLLAVPLVVGDAVDALTRAVETGEGLLEAARRTVPTRAFLLVGLVILIALCRFGWRHFFFLAARRSEVEIREKILERALSLPVTHFATRSTGEVMALATNDLASVRMALAMGFVASFDATLFATGALAAMVLLDWRLTMWTVLPFPLLGLVMYWALRLIYLRWDRVQKTFEDLTEKARESLAGMRVLRAYVQEEGDCRDFERYNRLCYHRYLEYVRVDSLFRPAVHALAGLSTALLLAVGGARVIQGEATLGTFTSFSMYLAQLTWPMIAAGWVVSLVQRGAVSMARIQDLLELPPETDRTRGPRGPFRGELEFRRLTFTYPGSSEPALVDFSCRIPAGGTLGIVGEVGSGKTTLVHLLVRLHEPPRGTVFLDGIDIQDIPLEALRRAISLVPQEPFLFSDTIEENLRLGRPEADRDAMVEACRRASLHEELLAFPQGYQTVLGERGVTLSGGQKQRLCLARALLKESPALVLDDTLSAVDADSERRILDRLGQVVKGRTTVVISHRISAVRDLDRILVLRRGRIVQQGRHDELIAQPGYYRQLYELQQLEAGE